MRSDIIQPNTYVKLILADYSCTYASTTADGILSLAWTE